MSGCDNGGEKMLALGFLKEERPREDSTWPKIAASVVEDEVDSVVVRCGVSVCAMFEARASSLPSPLGGIVGSWGVGLTLKKGRKCICV